MAGNETIHVNLTLHESNLCIEGEILSDELFDNKIGETLVIFDAIINGVEVGEFNCNPEITAKVLSSARGIT